MAANLFRWHYHYIFVGIVNHGRRDGSLIELLAALVRGAGLEASGGALVPGVIQIVHYLVVELVLDCLLYALSVIDHACFKVDI